MRKSFLYFVGSFSIGVLLLSSCTSNADSPGLEYMPDMYRSPALEAYVDYGEVRGRIDESKKTQLKALTPPSNTFPYIDIKHADSITLKIMLHKYVMNDKWRQSHGLYGEKVTTEDTYEAAAADKNLLKLSDKVLAEGKELFTAMCQHCHGEKGDGNGPMVVSGAYSGVPNYAEKIALSDGQMFYSIYYGKGMMGSHRSLLNKKEIWTVIHYIRQLQDPNYGKAPAQPNVTQDTIN